MDRAAVSSLDGEVVLLPACLSRGEPVPPPPEGWIAVTAEDGRQGFAPDWAAQGEGSVCLWGPE